MDTHVEDRLREQGITAEPLSSAEARMLWQRWRETFALAVKEATGKWVHFGYHWHAFSYGFTHALAREKALAAYRVLWSTAGEQEPPHELILLPGFNGSGALRCVAPKPLELTRAECLVCPLDFAWTMSFTHEDGLLGPYFTTADWALNLRPAAPRGRRPRRR